MATEKEPTKEELEASQAKADAEFQKLIETPLSKEDAEKELSDNDINRMQLMTVRQKWQTQITQLQLQISSLDEQLHALEMERAVIFRRTLNKAGEQPKPATGEIIGGKED